MNRRTFLRGSGLGVAAAGLGLQNLPVPATADAAEEMRRALLNLYGDGRSEWLMIDNSRA